MMFRRWLCWAAVSGLVITSPMIAPSPARAAGTTDWRCNTRADTAQTLVLNPSDFTKPNQDRRIIDLECRFTPNLPGPSQVTLCIAAPDGENGGGLARRLRRRGGTETIEYRLTGQTGNVPSALPVPIGDLRPTPQPLYTVSVDHWESGIVSFRHQFALVTEFQPIAGRTLPEGEYADTVTGFAASIHEGNDCGFLLWGPPNDSLGTAADVSTTIRIPASCSIAVTDSIDFGIIANPQNEQRDDGAFAVQCSPGTIYKLELGDGNHADGGTRRMTLDGASGNSSDYLAYQLLKPDGTPWNATGSAISGSVLAGTGLGTPQSVKVTGRIAPGTPLPRPGRYSDTVIVTLIH